MKYYGIDITQHKEHCISAELNEGSFTCTRNNPVSCLPAAILPEYRGESVVMASDAESDCHNKTLLQRRGLGLLWPRDTQIPVGQKDWNNGIGRVPLLSCLSNIKEAGNADEWKLIESRISWTPHPGKQLSFSNAELLGGLFKKIKDAEQICFVVPEEFGENAQQTLLEEFPENTLLIPRSIALAVQWCKDHREQYSHLHFPMGESKSLGHLLCASLGFGEWEVSLIEIVALQHNGEVHLVPVYDPRIRNHGLDFCGIALCSQLNGDGNTFSGETWRLLCSGSYMDYLLKNGVDQDTQKRIYQTLLNPSKTMLPYPELTIMYGLKKKHVLRDSIISKINLCLKQQIHQMSHFQKIIGVAAGGSFAKFSIMSEKNISGHEMNPADASFYQMSLAKLQHLAAIGHYKAARILEYRRKVEENQQNSTETIASYLFRSTITEHCPLSLYGSGVFASGGAIASYCISHDLPSYQIKLLPLDLYTIGRNKQGDKIEKWECLVDDQTIKAGSVYKQPYPINGLVIPEGKEHLELTLRRPDSEGKFMYRSVMAKINKKTDCKEPVEITTDVRPGQGFAKVWINSQRQGVFSTQLDWRTMRAVKKPELLLEYIPNIAFIVSHEEYWTVAKYAIRRFLADDTDDTQDPIGIYKDVLYSMNKFRWEKNSNNIYRHIGPINNDGVSSGLLDASVLKKFQTALVNKWKQSSEGSIKNRLLRIGGWLYLFIPKEMQENVIMNLKMGTEKNFHLHVAGLTFHKEKHFSEFYKAFCKKTDPNAEWFRSLRNIVRFRDNALSDEILEEAQLSRILEYVIHNLRYYSPYNQRNKYNNCIEVLIYLLKRRRYDENFLAPESQNTLELKDLLQNIAQKHPTVKYRKIAEQTLVFLNKEATSENLAAILESTEDEDSDED